MELLTSNYDLFMTTMLIVFGVIILYILVDTWREDNKEKENDRKYRNGSDKKY